MKRLKIILLTGLMLIGISCFTACEGSNEISLENQPNTADIANAVMEAVDFPSATAKTINDLNNYIDLEIENIYQMSYYICGSGAYPDELLILKLKDKSYSEDAKKAIQKKLDSQIETYRDYTPDEMYKLDGAKIIVKNNWVFFFATADNDKTEEIINSYF